MNLDFQVNKPIVVVFDYLSNMQKFVSIHPVITKMDDLGNNKYLVNETLKFGPIPFSFTYPVTIEVLEAGKKISYKATVMKITKIEFAFTLTQNQDLSTTVEEVIAINSILPIKAMMNKIFREQHTQLFKNLDELTVS